MKANIQVLGLKRFSVKVTFMVAAYAATAILSIPAFGGDDRHGPDTSGLDTRTVLAQSTTEEQISLANLKCSYDMLKSLQKAVGSKALKPLYIWPSPSTVLDQVVIRQIGTAKTKDGRSIGNIQMPFAAEYSEGNPTGRGINQGYGRLMVSVGDSWPYYKFEDDTSSDFPAIMYDRYVDKLKLDGLGRIQNIEERVIFRGFRKGAYATKLFRVEDLGKGVEKVRYETELVLDIEGYKACVISELSK